MSAPRVCLKDPRIAQAFNLFADYINRLEGLVVITGVPTLMGNVLRVDEVNGNDVAASAAPPGSFAVPYLTVQVAVNNASDGDVVLIGPGTFAENVVIPNTSPGGGLLTNLSIIGAGINQTNISPAAGISLSTAGTNTNLLNLTIKDISLVGGAAAGLSIDGATSPGPRNALGTAVGGLYMDSVRLANNGGAPALVLNIVNNVQMVNCFTNSGDTLGFTSVSSVQMQDCQTGQITFTYLDAGNKPSGARAGKRLYNCRFAGLVMAGLDDIACDSACISSAAITITARDGVIIAGTNGIFEFHGICAAAMALNSELTVGARIAYICDRCKVTGTLTVADITAPGTILGTADFRGSVLTTTGAKTIISGDFTNIDLRGATFNQTALDSAGATPGTINRSKHRQASALLAAGNAITFQVGGETVPFPDAAYSILFENTIVATDIVISAKAAGGFTATSAAIDAGAVFVVIHD